MSVSPKIMNEAQKFNPDNVVILFDLDMRSIGGSIFRFTPEIGYAGNLLLASGEEVLLESGEGIALENDGPIPIAWRGNIYLSVPAEAKGFELSSSGSFPRPTLSIANVFGVLKAEMLQRNNLIGATVTRWRTFAKHLDGGNDPDPDIYFPPDIYKIDRKSAEDDTWVNFELAAVIDQEGVMLPRRQILRNTCTHVYRVWDAFAGEFDYTKATCPYAGDAYFDENGQAVALPQDDIPSKLTDSCCRNRFPNQALPTRAFPGVGRFK